MQFSGRYCGYGDGAYGHRGSRTSLLLAHGHGHGDEEESNGGRSVMGAMERIERLAGESAVVVFSMTECCMSHVVKRLLCNLGVNPTVYEVDEEPDAQSITSALSHLLGGADPTPAVFVGGKLIGGLDRVMTSHINGSLVPLLKDAGALWL